MSQSPCDSYQNISFEQMVKSLSNTAKTGLRRFYPQTSNDLPYSTGLDSRGNWQLKGVSLRYAAISQIGISQWIRYHPKDKTTLPILWPKIADNHDKITHIGDFALALWAGVTSEADNCDIFARALSLGWQAQADLCNAVELAWIVQACVLALLEHNDLKSCLEPLLREAKNRLVSLFKPQHNLFRRHNRTGLKEVIGKRVACFADQVYPIIALSTYGRCFDDKHSTELAARAAEQICRLQGHLGQWWWHYDTAEGRVCEEYPVFSVHQDAMAPMAIMANDRLTGLNHRRKIELGLRWSFGNNELNENLILDDTGIIWRDIEKREPVKISRILRGFLSVAGLQSLHRLAGKCFFGFRINRECRPYHLGWILYAWADYRSEA